MRCRTGGSQTDAGLRLAATGRTEIAHAFAHDAIGAGRTGSFATAVFKGALSGRMTENVYKYIVVVNAIPTFRPPSRLCSDSNRFDDRTTLRFDSDTASDSFAQTSGIDILQFNRSFDLLANRKLSQECAPSYFAYSVCPRNRCCTYTDSVPCTRPACNRRGTWERTSASSTMPQHPLLLWPDQRSSGCTRHYVQHIRRSRIRCVWFS